MGRVDSGNPLSFAFLAGMSTLLIGGIALDRIIEARVPPAAPASFRA